MKFSELAIGQTFGLKVGSKIETATKLESRRYRFESGYRAGQSWTTSGNATVYDIGAELPPKRIITTSKEAKSVYKNKRDGVLNEAAKRAGFASWSKLETAILKGSGVNIPPKT